MTEQTDCPLRTVDAADKLAYGVNLRSRAGASATSLNRTVTEALSALTDTKESLTDG
jgi:hypothetical protein